jgi:cephalosporin hydroxylase
MDEVKMNPVEEYKNARDIQVRNNLTDKKLNNIYSRFLQEIHRTNYVKNFTWMGRPILQFPSDMFVMQELIWEIQPDYVIETGMAFGGSAVFYASVMRSGLVISIDVEIREHNQMAVIRHPLSKGIVMIEGDSVSPTTLLAAKDTVDYYEQNIRWTDRRIMVCLDSNHTHNHVLRELELWGPLVSVGSYMVVFDTAIAYVMSEQPADRPWGPGNNPMTAVNEFLKTHDEFVVDREVEKRALITACPGGWLKKIK